MTNFQRKKCEKLIGLVLCCVGMLPVWGCNQQPVPDYASLGLAEVSGTIRLDEQPLAHANIIFESADETFSSGKTNASGEYSLMFNSEQSGVTTGEKVVRIQMLEAFGDGEAEALPIGSVELPSSYNRNSELTATVIAGKQIIDFDLNSDGTIESSSQ